MVTLEVPQLTMSSGYQIPQFGFGTFLIPPAQTKAAVSLALAEGIRHIDTAQMYQNEAQVGQAIAESGISREEIFLTTKLDNGNHLPADARATFAQSLEDLQTDYVDLFLIHWPTPKLYGGDFVQTWRTLLEFADSGQAKSVGVSNFEPAHLDRLVAETGVAPALNQVESHPQFQNLAVHAADQRLGIITAAWSPLGRAKILEHPTLQALAQEVGKTVAQVILRWALQRGDIVFPKATQPAHLRENLQIFDFTLTPAQMDTIYALDQGEPGRIGSHPNQKC